MWKYSDLKNVVLFCLLKLLKDSSFLAPLLTRLTNYMIFHKG